VDKFNKISINPLYIFCLTCLLTFILMNYHVINHELPEHINKGKSNDLVIQIKYKHEIPVTYYLNQFNINKIEEILNKPRNRIINGTKYSINDKGVYSSEPMSAEDKISLNILIDLNSATLNDLVSLPGIGINTAENIINYRSKNGNFTNTGDLQKVYGIGVKKYYRIKKLITIE